MGFRSRVCDGITAAVFGLIDFATIRRARLAILGGSMRSAYNCHAAYTFKLILRVGDPLESVVRLEFLHSYCSGAGVTGWMGGELTFRSAIGVTGHAKMEEKSSAES